MSGQDPMPEGQWLYRRIYTWSLTACVLGLLAFIVWRMPPAMLQLVALWLIGLLALIATYYLLAPSAPELATLFEKLRVRIGLPGADRGDTQ